MWERVEELTARVGKLEDAAAATALLGVELARIRDRLNYIEMMRERFLAWEQRLPKPIPVVTPLVDANTERQRRVAVYDGVSLLEELAQWRSRFSTPDICAKRIEELEAALARARVATTVP